MNFTSEQKQTVTEILCLLYCTFVTLNSRQVSKDDMVLNVMHHCQKPTELKHCIILQMRPPNAGILNMCT